MRHSKAIGEELWHRALGGKNAILLGAPLPAAPPLPHRLVRIDCAAWSRPLGPMLDLRDQLERLIAETHAPLMVFADGDREHAYDGPATHLVLTLNKLQRRLGCPLVIAIQALHAADAATLQLLEQLLSSPTQLLASFVLQSDHASVEGPAGALVEHVLDSHGPSALVRGSDAPPPPTVSDGRGAAGLPVDVLRVLRAAAVVGDTFEVDLVAGLLALDPYTTLELLQMAIDEGVALEDRRNGIFRLPPGMGDELRARTTPSLAAAWHADLAAMMSTPEHSEEVWDEGDAVASPGVDLSLDRLASRPDALRDLANKWRGRDLTSRGAEHAEAAGKSKAAALRYVAAAEEASAIGGHGRAIELVQRAIKLLPHAPATDDERDLLARVLLADGRVLWRGAGSAQTTLEHALEPLQRAREILGSSTTEVSAEINALIAKVAYDIGDSAHFDLALHALREAQGTLLDLGNPLAAARLLNEEAAVLVRLGELGKAAELLARSRDVFLRHADQSDDARRELAQTDHLVARLPLHSQPGTHDEDSLAFATTCAATAERVYAELNDTREHARVHETLGRLARLKGRPEEARSLLQRAFSRQQEIGDAIGLARTTAALAELLADFGLPDDALAVLSNSINLNLQLGSRQGVAYNMRGLDDLERTLGDLSPDVAGAIGEMRSRLETAAASV